MDYNDTTPDQTRNVWQAVAKTVARQVRFPTFMRAVTESIIFSCVFLAAGYISLGYPITSMLAPMVPVVLIMMLSMVLSGVYREEITNSIINLYVHSAYGFALASITCVAFVAVVEPEYANLKFTFFFLFFAFFVMNTMRPLISGTDFMDGGGRRTN